MRSIGSKGPVQSAGGVRDNLSISRAFARLPSTAMRSPFPAGRGGKRSYSLRCTVSKGT